MKRCRIVCFCALSLAALCLPLAAGESATSIAPFLAVWPLALIALLLGYRRMENEPSAYRHVSLWLLSLAFAGVATLGQSFAAVGTAELATAHKLRTLVFLAGRVPLYYMGMTLLRAWLTRDEQPGGRAAAWFDRLPAWAFALALLVCWLPYAVMLFPGTVSSDSITMLSEIVGVKPMSNGNPIFQTFLLELCVKLGFGSGDRAVAIYCGVQALLMAWLLGCTVKRVRAVRRWLAAAALALYALCPIFPTFAFCVGKDTTFAMAVLWLMLEALRFLTEERYRGWWRLAIAGALCALLRNPGVVLAALTLIGLLLEGLRRKAWLSPTLGLCAVAAAWLTVNLLIVPTLAIEPTPETENWSVPLQQVARVVASQPVAEDERAAIAAVLDYDALHAEYNGELSDPVKNLWRADATPAQKKAFFGVWLRLLREHPATCLSATFHNCYGYLLPGYLSTLKPTLILGATSRTTAIDGRFDYTINPRAEKLKQTLAALMNDAPPLRLLISGGLYGWVALFAFVCALTGKRKRIALCLTPAVFTLLGCLFSAVNGYIRYTMPLYFAAPLCLAAASLACGQKEQQL